MPKGYWIAHVDVNDEDAYKPYAAANPAIFRKYRWALCRARRTIRMPGGDQPVAQRRH